MSSSVRVVTTDGVQVLSGMTGADRSMVGLYNHSFQHAVNCGRLGSGLRDFNGFTVVGYVESIYDTPVTVTLNTDSRRLEAMCTDGELDFIPTKCLVGKPCAFS